MSRLLKDEPEQVLDAPLLPAEAESRCPAALGYAQLERGDQVARPPN